MKCLASGCDQEAKIKYCSNECQSRQWHLDYYRQNRSARILQVKEYEANNQEKIKARRQAYYARNRELIKAKSRKRRLDNPEYNRKSQLMWRYGLTVEVYEAMLLAQDGKCAACEELFVATPHVDHNHHTGQVRELLCGECNFAAGKLRDDPDLAMRLALYLERHAAHPSGLTVPDRSV